MWFEVCEWGEDEPWQWGITTANSWRIHQDHLPLWWGDQGTANIIESFANKSQFAGVQGDNVYVLFLLCACVARASVITL